MYLNALREFGQAAERLEPVRVDVGGFLVPGREPTSLSCPGTGESSNEHQREEAGPTAGARQRPQAEAAAPGEATHSFGSLIVPGVTAAEFEELVDYFPDLRIVASSSRFVTYAMSAGLFHDLPYRACLYLEVPRLTMDARTRPYLPFWYPGPVLETPDDLRGVPFVPVIRAVACWCGAQGTNTEITSHHRYPDDSICACMPHQWLRGVDGILDYAGMCVSWIGKALHEREIGFYPGPQHLPPWIRLERDRPDEFCGCGGRLRYAECCRAADYRMPASQLRSEREQARRLYLRQLLWQNRSRSVATN